MLVTNCRNLLRKAANDAYRLDPQPGPRPTPTFPDPLPDPLERFSNQPSPLRVL